MIAYFCSGYPVVSHTFIFKEISELRNNGLEILTASINRFKSWPKMTEEERMEGKNTFYIKNFLTTPLSGFRLLFFYLFSPFLSLQSLLWTLKFVVFNGPKSLTKAIGYFLEAGVLAIWIKEKQITHLHIHFANPAATVALIAQKMYAFQFSLSVHGPDIFYNTEPNLLTEKIKRAEFIRCISYYCRSQLMRLVPYEQWGKFHIIRCGVDLSKFSVRPSPGNKIPQILCVGRLTKNKGQHMLLQIKKRNFHLTFVGDGEERKSLERLESESGLNGYVMFTGSIGQDKIKDYYKKTDLFVLPSFAEGVPVVLMEAMAMGIPVISTKIAGIPELIEDGKNGFLVFPSNGEELAKKIELLLADSKTRNSFSKQARLTIEKSYDINKNCRVLTEFFRRG